MTASQRIEKRMEAENRREAAPGLSLAADIRKKAADCRGASLSVALLFFIMCAVVGSVVLSAASTSVGRIRNADMGVEERYALSSAAELLVKKLAGGRAYTELASNGTYVSTNGSRVTVNANGVISSTVGFHYWLSEDNSKYAEWPASAENPDPAQQLQEINGLYLTADESAGEKIPEKPELMVKSDTVDESEISADSLEELRQLMSQKILNYYWPDIWGKWDDPEIRERKESGLPGDWSLEAVPAGGSWNFGSDLDTGKDTDEWDSDWYTKVVAVEKLNFSLTDNAAGENTDGYHVIALLAMDHTFNIRARLYLKKEDDPDRKTMENYKNAVYSCFVKIPAVSAGSVRYSEEEKKSEDDDGDLPDERTVYHRFEYKYEALRRSEVTGDDGKTTVQYSWDPVSAPAGEADHTDWIPADEVSDEDQEQFFFGDDGVQYHRTVTVKTKTYVPVTRRITVIPPRWAEEDGCEITTIDPMDSQDAGSGQP